MTINYQLCQLGIVLLDNDVRLSQVRHNITVLLEIFLLVVSHMCLPWGPPRLSGNHLHLSWPFTLMCNVPVFSYSTKSLSERLLWQETKA